MTELYYNPAYDPERAQPLLESLSRFVNDQRYREAADLMIAGQDVIDPVLALEYMGAKNRLSADMGERLRWGLAVTRLASRLDTDALPEHSAATVERLVNDAEFERIITNPQAAPEPAVNEEALRPAEVHWREVEFRVHLANKLRPGLERNPIFKEARAFAQGHLEPPIAGISGLEMARKTIKNRVTGPGAERLMLILLDELVYQYALDYVTGKRQPDDPEQHSIEAAKQVVDEHAFSDESRAVMHASLDKYIYSQAEAAFKILADPDSGRHEIIGRALEHIDKFASSQQVAEEMRKDLDMLVYRRARAYARGIIKSPTPSISGQAMAIRVTEYASSAAVRDSILKILDLKN